MAFWRRGRPISMALQGGGAHGAFAWGVLDAFLAGGRVRLCAFSAASAGAMNAVVCADGLMRGGPDAARARLEDFWRGVSRAGALFNPNHAGAWDAFMKGLGVAAPGSGFAFFEALSRMTSPYDRNPFNVNPLREMLRDSIDFEQLRLAKAPKVFISATNVRTGAMRIFDNRDLSAEAVLASACLPFLFQAVEIDGEHFWDGGYTGNPPLSPLARAGAPGDAVLVHLNPIVRDEAPTSADQIMGRLNEISFNASVLSELRMIASTQDLLRGRRFLSGEHRRLRDLRLHAILADEALNDLAANSKYDTSWPLLCDLRDRGRRAADDWLASDGRSLGKRTTLRAPFPVARAAK